MTDDHGLFTFIQKTTSEEKNRWMQHFLRPFSDGVCVAKNCIDPNDHIE